MATFIITDEPEGYTKSPMVTWNGTPVPVGTPLAVNRDEDGTEWYEVLLPDPDVPDFSEWHEAYPGVIGRPLS